MRSIHTTQRDIVLDSINEGVFTVDLRWRVTSFNRAAERITGVSRSRALGQKCCEVFRANICENECALETTITSGKPALNRSVFIVDAIGTRIPVKISTAALRDSRGQVIGGVETFQDLRQIEELKKTLREKHTFSDIVGKSLPMKQLFDILPQIASSNSTVLIQGPSGSGKELFAQALHNLSSRHKRPFITVNCGALPDSLLQSELFGYKKGAFTDARIDKPGRFALADGGTLFLDEISNISPAMQVSLLRVLQERTFEPLGSVQTLRSDFRVIAATNRDLGKLVQQELFRKDLYYRIDVIKMEIPPLSDRREDIPILVDHFTAKYNRLQGKEILGLTQEAMGIVMEYDYPGNVRQLQNVIEHAFVLCKGGWIEPRHLPPEMRSRCVDALLRGPYGMNLKSAECLLITEALRESAGNRAFAAAALGIDVSTLYRKILFHHIQTPDSDGRGRRKVRLADLEDNYK